MEAAAQAEAVASVNQIPIDKLPNWLIREFDDLANIAKGAVEGGAMAILAIERVNFVLDCPSAVRNNDASLALIVQKQHLAPMRISK